MTAKQVQIGDRPCRIYGADCAEYLLLQMTDEHELQRMDNEVAAIAQGAAHPFLFAAVPVESWNDELSPWEAPAVWGKESFGGDAADTLHFLTEQVIPTLKQRFALPENVRIILGGYSLAGLFALWASTQTALFSGVAAASPFVWFPGWMKFEQQHPIQAQRVGIEFHEDPWVGYIGQRGTGMMFAPGMMFTIEPMINEGTEEVFVDGDDDWSVYTKDGKASAQWEIQVLVTEDGHEVLSW